MLETFMYQVKCSFLSPVKVHILELETGSFIVEVKELEVRLLEMRITSLA